MKKILSIILLLAVLCLAEACGDKSMSSNTSTLAPISSTNESTTGTSEGATEKQEISTNTVEIGSIDELEDLVLKDVEDTIAELASEYDDLLLEIDSYDKYIASTDKIEAFYEKLLNSNQALCIRMREYSLNYANIVVSSDKTNDDKYDDIEGLYDYIYDDAGDEIYDGIYDGILEQMYDDYYDGILDDAYDTVPYEEWSDARSNEYDWWSDTRSDVYSDWSDYRSDVYDFYSDIRSELWSDDLERANEKIEDFRDDIEKIKSRLGSSSSVEIETVSVAQSDIPETSATDESTIASVAEGQEVTEEQEVTEAGSGLIDGMRPEFKEAMDSYEAFYDEYCSFMESYNKNPSDITLLAKYGSMITELTDMNSKFEAWDDGELNSTELKYYAEVNSRITQKLLAIN